MRFAYTYRQLAAAALSAVVFATTTVGASAQRLLADISGKWTMTMAAPDGAIESSIVFKQEADSLTGTIESRFAATKLTGTVKGDTVRFTYAITVQGMQFELTANGMVKDKDNIAGQLSAPGGMGTFPFTMKRVSDSSVGQ